MQVVGQEIELILAAWHTQHQLNLQVSEKNKANVIKDQQAKVFELPFQQNRVLCLL